MASGFDPNAALSLAVGHHQAGRVAQAEDLYRQILLTNPQQVDALHNLGLILANRGAMSEAIPLFQAALETAPSVTQFWFSLIEALIVTGQGDAATSLIDLAKTHKINGPQLDQLAERANALRDPYVAAYQRHFAGDLDGAAGLYKEIDATHPRYADSLMMRGLILAQQGHAAHGLTLLEDAVVADPSHAIAFYHRANTERQFGQHGPAIQYFSMAIALDPGMKAAFESLTLSLVAIGQAMAAQNVLAKAQRLDPQSAQIQSDLGSIAFMNGASERAILPYAAANVLQPGHAIYWYNIATAISGSDRVHASLPLYQRALHIDPTFAPAYGNYGAALRHCGFPEQALSYLREGARQAPSNFQIFGTIGLCLLDLGRNDDAAIEFAGSLVIQPDFAESLSNLALAQPAIEQTHARARTLGRALTVNPNLPETLKNYADQLRDNLNWSDAAIWYQKALAVRVDFINALCSLGAVRMMQKRPKEALNIYERVLKIDPAYPEAHFNQSLVYLAESNYVKGWEKYEWRRKTGTARSRHDGLPRWDGTQDTSGTLLLHTEQGFGDAIQFARYIPLVAASWGRVILDLPPQLAGLFAQSFDHVEIFTGGPVMPQFHYHCELMSVPWMLRESSLALPSGVPYLRTDPARDDNWRARLATQKLKIGIAWRGNPRQARDRFRSSTANVFAAMIDRVDICAIVLQKDVRPDEIEILADTRAQIFDASGDLHDFLDTASVIANLDLVLTVDTSICHLAGALAAKTWTLLEAAPDWRYLLEGNQSPWYPSMRLFRQLPEVGWSGIADDVILALAAEYGPSLHV